MNTHEKAGYGAALAVIAVALALIVGAVVTGIWAVVHVVNHFTR
jgi:hypothetical protein